MRVTYLGAGAAGMICGSCLRDNALARELRALDCEVVFVPLYTPITTDEADSSDDALLFGGVSVYLEQKSWLFRRLPRFILRWLDRPTFVRRVAEKRQIEVEATALGELTLSMLQGEHGNQRQEVARAVDWINNEARPDLVNLTNLLIAGFVPALRQRLAAPILVTLQGDDLFLDELTAEHRPQVLSELRRLAKEIDGFITFSEFYAEAMSKLLEVPREKFHLVKLGIDTEDFAELERRPDRSPTIGYFGRIAAEKGFGQIVDAFIMMHKRNAGCDVTLKAGGWLGAGDREYFDAQVTKLEAAGLGAKFEYVGAPDRAGKLAFFESIDVFSLPTLYREPKGMSVLEALASGVPVVQPAHGAFPEMLADTGGGILFDPGNTGELATALTELIDDPESRIRLGEQGRNGVTEGRTARKMAKQTLKIYENFGPPSPK
jgi:glycosyltransferase involved in cell wall biosynthesis